MKYRITNTQNRQFNFFAIDNDGNTFDVSLMPHQTVELDFTLSRGTSIYERKGLIKIEKVVEQEPIITDIESFKNKLFDALAVHIPRALLEGSTTENTKKEPPVKPKPQQKPKAKKKAPAKKKAKPRKKNEL